MVIFFAFLYLQQDTLHVEIIKSMNKIYGFEGEVRSQLSETFIKLSAKVVCCQPLAHVINVKVFTVHGGLLSVDGVKLSNIRSID